MATCNSVMELSQLHHDPAAAANGSCAGLAVLLQQSDGSLCRAAVCTTAVVQCIDMLA